MLLPISDHVQSHEGFILFSQFVHSTARFDRARLLDFVKMLLSIVTVLLSAFSLLCLAVSLNFHRVFYLRGLTLPSRLQRIILRIDKETKHIRSLALDRNARTTRPQLLSYPLPYLECRGTRLRSQRQLPRLRLLE